MKKIKLIVLLSLFLFSGCAGEQAGNNAGSTSVGAPPADSKTTPSDDLKKAMRAIEPFFKVMGEPKPDEWQATFKESGQTFEQYINFNPTLPTGERRKLYVQPIGKFSTDERKIIQQTVEYMESFFNLPVEMLADKKFAHPLSLEDSRTNQIWKIKQVRTGYVMDKLLIPALPADAAALIAFTNEDLYPDETMNFVFGQANLANRVAV